MRAISIGIRCLSVIILIITFLWWQSLSYDVFFSCPNIFWIGIGYFGPFIMAVFGTIIVVAYRHSNKQYKWWFRIAILGAFSPWMLLFVIIVCQYFGIHPMIK